MDTFPFACAGVAILRGPEWNGLASGGTAPVTWSETQNIKSKAAVRGVKLFKHQISRCAGNDVFTCSGVSAPFQPACVFS